MFEQHPIPQNIKSYQFRLVGDMTLKQFLQLAGGIGVALLIYSLPLLNILKWPLMFIAGALGAAFAFLPIQNRPLGFWMGAFLRSIYSPTIFSWENKQFEFFTTEIATQQPTSSQTASATPTTKDNGPTEGNIPKPEFMDTLENTEKEFLSRIQNMFSRMPTLPKTQTTNTPNIPKEEIHVVAQTIDPVIPAPVLNNKANETVLSNDAKDYLLNQTQNQPIETKKEEDKPIAVPQTPIISFQKSDVQPNTTSQSVYQAPKPINTPIATITPQTPTINATASVAPSTFLNSTATPPMTPEKPNIFVGQLIGKDGQIVESAIIDIVDSAGRPVRALRSNKAGHFMIVTPLQNGTYTISIEKEGHNFAPVSITINGNIVPPILIKE